VAVHMHGVHVVRVRFSASRLKLCEGGMSKQWVLLALEKRSLVEHIFEPSSAKKISNKGTETVSFDSRLPD
jgi:hypothetical protein